MNGDFGLVWDGPESKTCTGVYGDYLKFNNPHKTSLYLASGLPIIIWKEAAMAQFVLKNECGIVIDSLDDIEFKLSKISSASYRKMKMNAEEIGKKLRSGHFTRSALRFITSNP